MTKYRLAVLAGDGIGQEVTPGAMRVLERAGELTGSYSVDATEFPWSCQRYVSHGHMMPPDAIDTLSEFDAIVLGAVGYPGVPDDVSLGEMLLPIRQSFDQYVNLRPLPNWPGLPTPLSRDDPIDILCIRENSEGEYAGVGSFYTNPAMGRVAFQTSVFTETGIERIARYAFERARERRRRVASATKSNALAYSGVLWDEVVTRVASEYADVELSSFHVDALAARFVSAPGSLDVVLGSNLFGDILSDLGAAVQGSLGLAASANLNPERRHPSMFEPVHGSAPDIAGRGIANPVGAISSIALLLEHLGQVEAADLVATATRTALQTGTLTQDLGGTASTSEVVDAVLHAMVTRTGTDEGVRPSLL